MSVGEQVRRNFEVVGRQSCEKALDCAAVEVGGRRRALGTGLLMEYLTECRGSNGAKCELDPSAFAGARCDRIDGGAGTCEVNP
ncbi:MAG: hypothetical protein JNK82_43630 [Myxococcaceae bacterium]|nr:hypothetical protein [Myxococcaceae bacterium]